MGGWGAFANGYKEAQSAELWAGLWFWALLLWPWYKASQLWPWGRNQHHHIPFWSPRSLYAHVLSGGSPWLWEWEICGLLSAQGSAPLWLLLFWIICPQGTNSGCLALDPSVSCLPMTSLLLKGSQRHFMSSVRHCTEYFVFIRSHVSHSLMRIC